MDANERSAETAKGKCDGHSPEPLEDVLLRLAKERELRAMRFDTAALRLAAMEVVACRSAREKLRSLHSAALTVEAFLRHSKTAVVDPYGQTVTCNLDELLHVLRPLRQELDV